MPAGEQREGGSKWIRTVSEDKMTWEYVIPIKVFNTERGKGEGESRGREREARTQKSGTKQGWEGAT